MAKAVQKKFLENALDIIRSKGIKNQDLTLIFPSNRALTEFKNIWKAQLTEAEPAIILPQMVTADKFFEQQAHRIPCTQDQVVEFLESVLEGTHPTYQIELDDKLRQFFLSMTAKLVQAFDEIIGYITEKDLPYSWAADQKRIAHFFETLSTVKLYESQTEIDITNLRDRKEFTWNRFPEIFYILLAWQDEHQLATSRYMQRLAVNKAVEMEDFGGRSIGLIGLYAFSEMEMRMWEIIHSKVEHWIYLPKLDQSYVGSFKNKHSAGHFFRTYKHKPWATGIADAPNLLEEHALQLTHIACQNKLVQLDYVAQHLRDNPPKEDEKIAIILFDLSMITELVDILEARQDINIAIGFPSGEYPLYVAWLNVIRPSWNNLQFATHLQNFCEFVSDEDRPQFESLKDIDQFIAQSKQWLSADEPNRDSTQPSYKAILRDILTLSEQESFANPHQQYKWFYSEINQIELFFKGEKTTNIHVIGMLETRTIDYDRIYGVSFMDSIYPKDFEYNSIIPFDVRQEYLLPLPEEKESVYAHNFYQHLHYTKQMYLTSYKTDDDEVSRYVTQIQYEQPTHYPNFRVETIQYAPLETKFATPKPFIVDHERYTELIKEYFQKSSLSKSSMQTFFKDFPTFVQERLLGFWQEEGTEEFATLQGQILHQALEKLLTPLLNCQIQQRDIDQTLERINACLDEALDKHYEANQSSDLYTYKNIYYRIFRQTLYKVVKEDVTEYMNEGTVIKALEQEYEYIYQHPVAGDVKLRGIVDCLLQKADGTMVILDFKSTTKSKPILEPIGVEDLWKVVSNTVPDKFDTDNRVQLQMYAYLYNQVANPSNAIQLKLRPLIKGKAVTMDINPDETMVMETVLNQVIDAYLDPNAIGFIDRNKLVED